MIKRRRMRKEKDNTDRWMLSYLDFITLMMIFFLMMYAISNVDNKKVETLANSLKIGFNSGNGKNVIAVTDNTNSPDSTDESVDESYSSTESEKLTDIKRKVDELVNNSELKGGVTTSIQERGLVISFNDNLFFNSGEATIKPDFQGKLISISKILNGIDNYIHVEGHTDNVAINTTYFHSNWQLSSIRAANVVEFLISQGNVKPERLSSIGYGEYRPVKSNSTEEGKAANRRVDIVIINSKFNSSESSTSR
ncbi:chemotaxis protein MotB [Clostridium saccharoperbutylacetonicum]|uniref:Motility protein B n=1 Tax=Clostridium saccharoperbutylacetonicum N1-4(HMT) TaxID=931276 RepID=M1MER0_9CLOT|nr:flagellar motor protein MotB [Clostridium saccharoperbutylacetonicum]AGF56404.1 motility protein B [Clostridium saccharoperbutylacetonicum N1-4(HMT)]NRT62852.1 chemotaxis protein MotB [Clostridium saccharoperbutylacetonicum]NSB26207.1 chemotaxis protein MotB [Clostridium saccharoperbutylacetonicum]NSB45560.1 chemotaxis protein MotB [Clostridium saccharoperbutylacetonicum]